MEPFPEFVLGGAGAPPKPRPSRPERKRDPSGRGTRERSPSGLQAARRQIDTSRETEQ